MTYRFDADYQSSIVKSLQSRNMKKIPQDWTDVTISRYDIEKTFKTNKMYFVATNNETGTTTKFEIDTGDALAITLGAHLESQQEN